jgi:hypothetical protein
MFSPFFYLLFFSFFSPSFLVARLSSLQSSVSLFFAILGVLCVILFFFATKPEPVIPSGVCVPSALRRSEESLLLHSSAST